MDEMTMRGQARVRPLCVFALAVVAAAGCDKITSKLAGGASKSSTAAAAPAKPSGLVVSQPMVSPAETVAKVNDRAISKREVELLLQNFKAAVEARGQTWTPPSEEQLKQLVDEMVLAELRAQDALARGWDRQTETQTRLGLLARDFFNQEWFTRQADQLTIGDSEVEAFYRANPQWFREPEQIRVRQIVLASEDQAKAVLVKLLEGADAASVAQQMSVRPEAAEEPLVGQWVMRAADKAARARGDDSIRELRDPALEQAAFAVDQTGGLSSYVKGADGNFHIFQLIERRPARQRSQLEVADDIKTMLRLERLNKLSGELEHKGKVEKFPERLSGVQ